jgi:hypothetical protein
VVEHIHISVINLEQFVIDLKLINSVQVMLEKKRVIVGGGAKIEVVDAALAGTGYAFSTGTNGDTGVSKF